MRWKSLEKHKDIENEEKTIGGLQLHDMYIKVDLAYLIINLMQGQLKGFLGLWKVREKLENFGF